MANIISVAISGHLLPSTLLQKCAWPVEGLRGSPRTFEVGLNRIEVAAGLPERLGCSYLSNRLTDRRVVLIAQRLV
jgi:hypothetical protein